jgi:hypothetical protein
MEELLKVVELVRQEAPKARVKVDSLMVTHYFTMEELLNICNKYADYKCALADVVGQSEQLKPLDADMQQALNELTESKAGNKPTKKRF